MKSKGVLLILSCLLVTSLFFLFVGEPSSSSSSSSTTSSSSSSAAASVASSTSDGGWVALPLRRSKQVVTSSSDSSSSFEEGKNHQEPSSYSNHFHPNDVPRHVEDWSNRIQGEKRELNSQQEIEEELSSPGEEDAVVNRALESLGFTSAPRTYPRVWTNISLPVVVTAVTSQMEDEEISKFLRRFHDSFPNFLLIIYTVSLDEKEFDSVNKSCNNSNLCLVRPFELDRFPSHVSDLRLKAFRPLIIQQVLDEVGAVAWINTDLFFYPEREVESSTQSLPLPSSSSSTFPSSSNATSSTKHPLSPGQLLTAAFEYAKNHEAILSWTIEQPTSALTHPKMFDYFKRQQSDFFFHRMIDPSSCLILLNTPRIHQRVMLPWVKCALTSDCISPIGAQSGGCRFDKKPLYRYSGCHFYDISALNVILGILFDYNEKPYADEERKFLFFSKDDPSTSVSHADDKPFPILTDASVITSHHISYHLGNPTTSTSSQHQQQYASNDDSSQSRKISNSSPSFSRQSRQRRNIQSKYLPSLSFLIESSPISSMSTQTWKNRRKRWSHSS